MVRENIQSEPIRRRVAVNITLVARHLRTQFDKNAGSVGVTRAQWTMIAFISREPGCSQRHIADMLEQSEASVGRVIDKLVKDGLLERRQKEDDRRTYALFLTEKVEPLLSELSTFAAQWEAAAFAGLDEQSLKQLEELLNIIYANIQAGRHTSRQ